MSARRDPLNYVNTYIVSDTKQFNGAKYRPHVFYERLATGCVLALEQGIADHNATSLQQGTLALIDMLVIS